MNEAIWSALIRVAKHLSSPYAELGEDRNPADGFTPVWRYPSQGLSAHLGIQAIGPGGTTDKTFGIAH